MAKNFVNGMESNQKRTAAAATYAPMTATTTDNGTETKTKRAQMLMTPSEWENMQKLATMAQTSVNGLVCNLIDEYIKANADTIAKYDAVFGK